MAIFKGKMLKSHLTVLFTVAIYFLATSIPCDAGFFWGCEARSNPENSKVMTSIYTFASWLPKSLPINPLTGSKLEVEKLAEVARTLQVNIQKAWTSAINYMANDETSFLAVALSEVRKYKNKYLSEKGQETKKDLSVEVNPQRILSKCEEETLSKENKAKHVANESIKLIKQRTNDLMKSMFLGELEELGMLMITSYVPFVSGSRIAFMVYRIQKRLMGYFIGIIWDVLSCAYGDKIEETAELKEARAAARTTEHDESLKFLRFLKFEPVEEREKENS